VVPRPYVGQRVGAPAVLHLPAERDRYTLLDGIIGLSVAHPTAYLQDNSEARCVVIFRR
jgi:hypothetical protein